MGIDDAAVYTAELDGLIAAAERRPAEPPGRGRASARHAAASASHASVWDGAQLALGLDDDQERRGRLQLPGKGSSPGAPLGAPLAAELDESRQRDGDLRSTSGRCRNAR
jgi:hypothetical protein